MPHASVIVSYKMVYYGSLCDILFVIVCCATFKLINLGGKKKEVCSQKLLVRKNPGVAVKLKENLRNNSENLHIIIVILCNIAVERLCKIAIHTNS